MTTVTVIENIKRAKEAIGAAELAATRDVTRPIATARDFRQPNPVAVLESRIAVH